ncbi:MAG: transposase [Bacteroidota bacterium]
MSTKTQYLHSQGEFFHSFNRDINREAIFLETRNYKYFIDRMVKNYDLTKIELVAYCLMPNHFHFIVRQVEAFGITEIFKGICSGYVKAINKAHHRSEQLFEGKYKMKPIDSNEYLLHLSRYVHLNPI